MATIQKVETPRYRASGRVVETATREGLPGLVVTLYHTEDPGETFGLAGAAHLAEAGRRLGSVMTDASGAFETAYLPLLGDRGGPHLVVTVAGTEGDETEGEGLLHVSARARRSAGPIETFSVAVDAKLLASPVPGAPATTKDRLETYKENWTEDHELATEIGAFHEDEVKERIAQRKVMRKELMDQIATDISVTAFPGEVATDKDIDQKADAVVERSVTKANSTIRQARGVPVTLYLNAADRLRLQPFLEAAVNGFAEIPETELDDILFREGSSDNPCTLLIHQNPIARFCAEQTFEELCATRHTDLALPEDEDDEDEKDPPAAIAPLTNETVPHYAARFLDGAPSPDSILSEAFAGKRQSKDGLEASVEDFSLRVGPADVPAYYDFQSLQIAFDHVWKVLIDESLVSKAVQLNTASVAKTGFTLAQRFDGPWTEAVEVAEVAYEDIPRALLRKCRRGFISRIQSGSYGA